MKTSTLLGYQTLHFPVFFLFSEASHSVSMNEPSSQGHKQLVRALQQSMQQQKQEVLWQAAQEMQKMMQRSGDRVRLFFHLLVFVSSN